MPPNILQSKSNTECSVTKFDKYTFGRRFSKFLSKIFWHFNQAIPNYSSINRHRTKSANKHILNFYQSSINDTDHDRTLYTKHYRTRLSQQRISTLMSIKEENENELMNCK